MSRHIDRIALQAIGVPADCLHCLPSRLLAGSPVSAGLLRGASTANVLSYFASATPTLRLANSYTPGGA